MCRSSYSAMGVLTSAALCVLPASSILVEEQEHAPLADKLVTAKTAYLINDSGDLKAYDRFYKDLKSWNQFAVVTSRDRADIVMVLTSSSQYAFSVASGSAVSSGGVTTGSATSVAVPSTSLHLKVFDAGTAEVVWTDVTEKWVTSGHAPAKLVANLKKRFPRPATPRK